MPPKKSKPSAPTIDASVPQDAALAVLDTLATSVAVVDLRSRVKRLNAAFEDLLGISRRLVTGTKLSQYFSEPDLLTQAIDAARQDAFTVTRFEASLQPERQALSLPVHVIVSRTEEPDTVMVELLPLDKQLRQEREERLVDQALANKALIRGLAHEIKNPLTPIQLSAERLQLKLEPKLETADAEILARSTQTIVNQVAALKRMVDAFSQYARTPEPAMRVLDMNGLIREVLALYESLGSSMKLNLASDLPAVQGDATQLRQVIHNLLQNAQDALAGAEAPRIEIATVLRDGRAEFSVTDNGTGFPEHLMKRVFEPYVTTKPRGTGLGLSIVRKIVEEHHGEVTITNVAPHGARIAIAITSRTSAIGTASGLYPRMLRRPMTTVS